MTQHFSGRSAPDKAESDYNTMVTKELSKFEKEYLPDPGSRDPGTATCVVVSILVAIRGDKTAFGDVMGSSTALAGALQMLGADVMTGSGDLLIAAELLWTPSERDEVLRWSL